MLAGASRLRRDRRSVAATQRWRKWLLSPKSVNPALKNPVISRDTAIGENLRNLRIL
jgi:hypothetical protein